VRLFGAAGPIPPPPGDRAVIENGVETIEPAPVDPPRALCQARARHFKGTVSVPCEDIARQIAP
jgi:hypothetical protein